MDFCKRIANRIFVILVSISEGKGLIVSQETIQLVRRERSSIL